jgi:hypothetical protein
VTTYNKGFLQILAEDDPLDLDYSILDEVMDILQRGIESRLRELLVLLRPQLGGQRAVAQHTAGEFSN